MLRYPYYKPSPHPDPRVQAEREKVQQEIDELRRYSDKLHDRAEGWRQTQEGNAELEDQLAADEASNGDTELDDLKDLIETQFPEDMKPEARDLLQRLREAKEMIDEVGPYLEQLHAEDAARKQELKDELSARIRARAEGETIEAQLVEDVELEVH